MDQTPFQTVGPFFHIGLTDPRSVSQIAGPSVKGERVKLICTVRDRANRPINDAMLEIWQANAEGKYNHPDDTQEMPVDPSFVGFGRMATDDQGMCVFDTIKPGRVPANDGGLQAPHLNVMAFARGLLRRMPTRIYFAGDPANDQDPVLALVPKERRGTLMAQAVPGEHGSWRFEVNFGGEQETVFFDV